MFGKQSAKKTSKVVSLAKAQADAFLKANRIAEACEHYTAAAALCGDAVAIATQELKYLTLLESRAAKTLSVQNSDAVVTMARSLLSRIASLEQATLLARTQYILGNALAAQGALMSGADARELLTEAVAAYAACLANPIEDEPSIFRAHAQADRARALGKLAGLSTGSESANLRDRASQAWRSAARYFEVTGDLDTWLLMEFEANASALAMERLLNQRVAQRVEKSYRTILAAISEDQKPDQWVDATLGLADILIFLANAEDKPERVPLLQEALEAYRASLKFRPVEMSPVAWEQICDKVVETCLSLAAAVEQHDRKVALYKVAIDANEDMLRKLSGVAPSGRLAEKQLSLAKVLKSEASILQNQDEIALLRAALALGRAAIATLGNAYERTNSVPFVVNVCLLLAERTPVPDGVGYVHEAKAYLEPIIARIRNQRASFFAAQLLKMLAEAYFSQARQSQAAERDALFDQASTVALSAFNTYDDGVFALDRAEAGALLATILSAWATTKEGDAQSALFEKAVDACRSSATPSLRSGFKTRWASAQVKLAETLREYAQHSDGNRRTMLLCDAAGAYKAAVRIFKVRFHVSDWALSKVGLAETELALARYGAAKSHVVAALAAVDSVLAARDERISRDLFERATALRAECVAARGE